MGGQGKSSLKGEGLGLDGRQVRQDPAMGRELAEMSLQLEVDGLEGDSQLATELLRTKGIG